LGSEPCGIRLGHDALAQMEPTRNANRRAKALRRYGTSIAFAAQQ
jgi:hypothetical protein